MVSPETMNSSISTIHGPICSRPAAASFAQSLGGFGTDREVVVDDDGLAVEQEPLVRLVALQEVEELVEQADESDAERLERRVPLPVPVRVGDDRHRHRHRWRGHRRPSLRTIGAVLDLARASVFLDFDGTVTLADTGVHALERLASDRWREITRGVQPRRDRQSRVPPR